MTWFFSSPRLPSPAGDYNVGYVDIMTEGRPEVGSYFRLYFPTDQSPHKSNDKCPQWTDIKEKRGLVSFMQAMLSFWPSWAPHTEFHLRDYISVIPCLHGVTMKAWNLFTSLHGALTVPLVPAARPADPSQGKYGVVVFSHGMGCHRNTYSKICYDLASQGVIVAAVEHRDGSAGSSYYSLDGLLHEVPHQLVPDRASEYNVRASQINHRAHEISRVIDILQDMHEGKDVRNVAVVEEEAVLDSSLEQDACLSSSVDQDSSLEQDACLSSSVDQDSSLEQDACLSWWEGKIDMERVYVSGHSFGGNSALRAAVRDQRIRGAGVMDPWMFPGHQDALRLSKPALVVHTESFIHVNNLEVLKAMLKDNDDVSAAVLRGAVHLSQTDMPMLFEPMLFGKDLVRSILGMKATLEPRQVLEKNHELLWGFIDSKMNARNNPGHTNLVDWGDELAKNNIC